MLTSKICRILIFDLLNGSFWSFFLNRSGFSRRIRIYCQKLQQNSLGKMIIEKCFLWPLTQDSILNIIQFRETTLKLGIWKFSRSKIFENRSQNVRKNEMKKYMLFKLYENEKISKKRFFRTKNQMTSLSCSNVFRFFKNSRNFGYFQKFSRLNFDEFYFSIYSTKLFETFFWIEVNFRGGSNVFIRNCIRINWEKLFYIHGKKNT